jgi:hypothetical protein
MRTKKVVKSLGWKRRYHLATLAGNSARQSMLEDAINAILDQIEKVRIQRDLDELNTALNVLRSRRKGAGHSKSGRSDSSHPTKAA